VSPYLAAHAMTDGGAGGVGAIKSVVAVPARAAVPVPALPLLPLGQGDHGEQPLGPHVESESPIR
jgi:hypothetical protein